MSLQTPTILTMTVTSISATLAVVIVLAAFAWLLYIWYSKYGVVEEDDVIVTKWFTVFLLLHLGERVDIKAGVVLQYVHSIIQQMALLTQRIINNHCRVNVPMLGKRLFTATDSLVQDHLEGLCGSVSHVRLLDGFPSIKVAVNAEHDRSRVALVSGGGSGHEPAFAGYVGDGMLSASACGDIFAAPSADAVFAAIRAVTGDAGCLLLPLNYTGDVINFGLAAERAKTEGFNVETVLINDDCAIRKTSSVGRRGLAGSVFVVKIIGALAQRGTPLAELASFARTMVSNLGTIGVGLDTCAQPGHSHEPSRLEANEIELGLGIHGEPGVEKVQQLSADEILHSMVTSIMTYDTTPFKQGDSVGVLINNLGSMTCMDLNIITKTACTILENRHRLKIEFALTGSYLTSVTVSGFSVTLLKMETGYLELLQESTNAAAWTVHSIAPFKRHAKLPLPTEDEEKIPDEKLTAVGSTVQACLQSVISCLNDKEEKLNAWDAKVGDGDCGTTLVTACAAIAEDMERYRLNNPSSVLKALSKSISRSAGGTSGALYSIFFTTASRSLASSSHGSLELVDWVEAFGNGINAIQKYGRARLGDRTMLDALHPAHISLKTSTESGLGLDEALQAMLAAATTGANSTIGKTAKAGRSSYVPEEHLLTTPDPGAMAVAFWLSAVVDAISSHS